MMSRSEQGEGSNLEMNHSVSLEEWHASSTALRLEATVGEAAGR
jgi:hypothetical protein